MGDEPEGVWGHIVSLVPKSELFEIEGLIGSTLIADNCALWRELKAFNSILTELHTLEFEEPLGATPRKSFTARPPTVAPLSSANLEMLSAAKPATSGGSFSGTGPGSSAVPALLLPEPISSNQHQLQQGELPEGSLTRRSTASGQTDSMEFIFAIQDRLSVDKIPGVLEEIRKALRSEKKELEAEVALLFSAMEGEADTVASRRKPSKGATVAATAAGSANDTVESAAGNLKGREAPISPDVEGPSLDLCRSCARVRDFASQQPGRIRKSSSLADAREQRLCFSCLDRERQARAAEESTGKGSKLRSRLQAARDEHHFLDD